MPARPRPDEVGVWFKAGRRLNTENHLPRIESLKDFEKKWKDWWSAIQPKWRDTKRWPYPKDAVEEDWGELPNGGKDGLFVVMVSLGWWIHVGKQKPGRDTKISDAVADVAWVINNLNSLLSTDAATTTDSDSAPNPRATAPSALRMEHHETVKIGPPRKRAKRTP